MKTPNPHAAALGRLGGSAKSKAKTRAARKNAKKGGWPKGRPRRISAAELLWWKKTLPLRKKPL
jgi:hypothetical protein